MSDEHVDVTLSDDELRAIADDAYAWYAASQSTRFYGVQWESMSVALPSVAALYAEGVIAERKRQRMQRNTLSDVRAMATEYGYLYLRPVDEWLHERLDELMSLRSNNAPLPAESQRAAELVIADLREIGGELARWISNSDHAPDCDVEDGDGRAATCSCGRAELLDRARNKGLIK